jgi:Na+-transporting methylmalonyl-CoA/oxaloacetate decarboxylase beta subunit
MGVGNELFPLLIFVGIGAHDRLRAAAGEPEDGAARRRRAVRHLPHAAAGAVPRLHHNQAASIGIIGAIDGPTSIYVSNKLAPELVAPITVAAYSYMSAGADHHAADHAPADHAEGTGHPHALHRARSASARASCSRSS